ncbi:MAG: vWA domain-containing protein [Mycobacterium sp.]
MTDPTKTLIAALLDRSGSMSQSKEATEDGWRELIEEQRGNPGRCQVTLAQFDTGYEVLYPPTDIDAVPDFTVEPGGMTALLDAAGRFITEVGQQLSALPEHERPGQVVCLIMTDGMENASQQWNWDDVQRLITQQREVYGWEFIFLGANIDAVGVGRRMGVDARFAMTYNDKDYGTNSLAYKLTTAVISDGRAGGFFSAGFTDEDRQAAMGE